MSAGGFRERSNLGSALPVGSDPFMGGREEGLEGGQPLRTSQGALATLLETYR